MCPKTDPCVRIETEITFLFFSALKRCKYEIAPPIIRIADKRGISTF